MNRLIFTALGVVLLFATSHKAQSSLDGQWEGVLVRAGAQAKVIVYFETRGNGLEGTMTMPTVGMFRQSLSKITYKYPDIHFEQENLAAILDGGVVADKIAGKLQVIGLEGTFYLKRSPETPLPYRQEEVRFDNGKVTLAGTLTIPLTHGAHAAIVFSHGGGPDTRDLSRFYADLFGRRGIATLIYDKRGVGASAPELDWGRSSFADLAGDALAGVRFLKTRTEIDPKRIGLYGPSNGGWVVEYAAARSKDVAFIIVVSGGGIPSWESEVHRVEAESHAEHLAENDINAAVAFMRQKFAVARTGQGWTELEELTGQSRTASWFRFVNAPGSLERLMEAWNGQFAYDPRSDLEALRIPVLGIFGELDTETPSKRIAAKTTAALRAGRNKDYTIKIFSHANHGIMTFPGDGERWYFFKFADGYVELLTRWVSARFRRRGMH